MVRVLNSQSGTLQKLPDQDEISIYVCGPTVYSTAHLGHARVYIMCDIYRRILENFFNYSVRTCMNITDIDDKIICRADESGQSISDISNKFTAEFLEDMKSLNVMPTEHCIKVTDHIDDIIRFIQKLVEVGAAYVKEPLAENL